MRAGLYVCSECAHECNPNEIELKNTLIVFDANGNVLQNDDSVTILKNLAVKGAPSPIKAGTKV